MIKFIAGLFMGAAFGFLVGAVLSADRPKGGLTVEPGEVFLSRQEFNKIAQQCFDGFEPAQDFDPFCPPVCGNCKHWDSEIFAWGVCKICKRSGVMREAGDVCNIRNGEVVRE